MKKPKRFSGVLEQKSCLCGPEDMNIGETSSIVVNQEPCEVQWLHACSCGNKQRETCYGFSIDML